MPSTTSVTNRSQWTVQKFTSFEDQRRWQVRQWQEAGEEARLAAAWELTTSAWEMQNRPLHELRLQRSAARVVSKGR